MFRNPNKKTRHGAVPDDTDPTTQAAQRARRARTGARLGRAATTPPEAAPAASQFTPEQLAQIAQAIAEGVVAAEPHRIVANSETEQALRRQMIAEARQKAIDARVPEWTETAQRVDPGMLRDQLRANPESVGHLEMNINGEKFSLGRPYAVTTQQQVGTRTESRRMGRDRQIPVMQDVTTYYWRFDGRDYNYGSKDDDRQSKPRPANERGPRLISQADLDAKISGWLEPNSSDRPSEIIQLEPPVEPNGFNIVPVDTDRVVDFASLNTGAAKRAAGNTWEGFTFYGHANAADHYNRDAPFQRRTVLDERTWNATRGRIETTELLLGTFDDQGRLCDLQSMLMNPDQNDFRKLVNLAFNDHQPGDFHQAEEPHWRVPTYPEQPAVVAPTASTGPAPTHP